ncbi:DUF58 domain-containing protein [Pseudoprimorskyibacter insulae]|uniref:DUF58 domain-containing protein n=1 Tax=Pseudoprimorskyibacter insulae TaxID=1695997 RepID=A0A2R8AZF8_9RHOB|nr:DUF58 domain-containing protein [Pseudoprimorskyibacter insulae]SPF81234.1 hypothetical protein PRI8871_03056 [Pseudoprimorskyibacter insulae]
MSDAAQLRLTAEEEAARLPALLAEARHLAGTVLLGDHGRRRPGQGDSFWQYRPMQPGDALRDIDWRRSARGDTQFIREREWQIAQSVQLWVNPAASMRFASNKSLPTKADRARVLGLACAVLLLQGGERVGLMGAALPPRGGRTQIDRIATALLSDIDQDFAEPEARGFVPNARAVFISDFLDDLTPVEVALSKAASRGVHGVLLQVLDPEEEVFPFRGRTLFESVGGTVRYESRKASEIRQAYLDRLAAQKDRLDRISRAAGWRYSCHHTGTSAQSSLLWLYRAMEGGAA